MKKLIATRADSKINNITAITLPVIKEYAEKCGADFKILDQEPPIWTTESPPRPHYRIMEFYNLFDEYDRILSCDCDLIINKTCPNIFEEVPKDCIGSIYEDVGRAQAHRRGQIKKVQEEFGDVGWTEGYINTGFAVFSKIHKKIFQPIDGKHYFMGFGIDDVHLCYHIHKYNFKIHQLNFKWNHMTMFSEAWNNYADRFEAYVLHYAGAGTYEEKNRAEQIKKDFQKLRNLQ